MFSTTGLFKNVACPQGEKCVLNICIFSHNLRPRAFDNSRQLDKATAAIDDFEDRENVKRRKRGAFVDHEASQDTAKLDSGTASELSKTNTINNNTAKSGSVPALKTLKKDVSPPPSQPTKKASKESSSVNPSPPVKKESLNPRVLPQAPAGHEKRMLYLKYIFEGMKKLNDDISSSTTEHKLALMLTEQELIISALDEEEQIAKTAGNVYANVMKNRIAALKKMKVEDWITHVKGAILNTRPQSDKPKPKSRPPPIETGLPISQEHVLLPRLVTDQTTLDKHGYVPVPPTEVDIQEAKDLVDKSHNYEVCDRCKSRFQVFPDRREGDGALTTNGPCVYHWGRPVWPKREKTDAIQGSREPAHSCCGEPLDYKGCSEMESHVYKIHDPKRMASVLPFIWTPENHRPAKGPSGKVPKGVTFDCEMGYTTYGLELIRLTAVSWPDGDQLVDVLVRPKGAILDLNSRFSGVWPETIKSSIPYDLYIPAPPGAGSDGTQSSRDREPHPIKQALPMVSSIEEARKLLCSFLSPKTPLIGHALENDLNSVRLCHPNIIDTVVVYRHPKGLPLRYGLKMLTKKYLHRDIQMGGAMGHDSLEDARATGDLVRHAIGTKWTELKSEGWTIAGEELMPPLPQEADVAEPQKRVLGGGSHLGLKRQRINVGTSQEGIADDPDTKRQRTNVDN